MPNKPRLYTVEEILKGMHLPKETDEPMPLPRALEFALHDHHTTKFGADFYIDSAMTEILVYKLLAILGLRERQITNQRKRRKSN